MRSKEKVKPQHSSKLAEVWWQLVLSRHQEAAFASWKRLYKNVYATILTILVIAVSLALPTILLVGLDNLTYVSHGFQDSAAISLYIKPGVSQREIDALMVDLHNDRDVASLRYISPSEGMQTFSKAMGLTDALSALPDNPLPAVIVVTPNVDATEPARVTALVDQLSRLPLVDTASLDMQWVKRLYAIIHVLHRAIILLSLLLGFGVLIVIGNTIRLALQQHREEIAIMKLMGATNAFARRPFLYTGIWYGFLGAILAWLLVSIFFIALGGVVHNLANSFNSPFHLSGLSIGGFLLLLLSGMLLGLAGSWIVVEQFINGVDKAGA